MRRSGARSQTLNFSRETRKYPQTKFCFLIIRISKKAFCSKLHFLQPVTRTANLCSSDILKNAILVKTEILPILAPEVQEEG